MLAVLALALALGAPALAGGSTPATGGDQLAKATDGGQMVAAKKCKMIKRCKKYGWKRVCLKLKPVKKCLVWKKVGQKKICAKFKLVKRCAKYTKKKYCLKYKLVKVCK
jgi:hypothetical protein